MTMKNVGAAPIDPTDDATKTYVDTAVAGKVTSLNVAVALWAGTQTQYDALGTKDATTIYVVSG